MNKYKKIKMYKEEYILTLNIFYEHYFNKVNNDILLKEYNLLFDVMVDLVYEHKDTWYIYFSEDKYKKTLIYRTDKEYWKMLSNLFDKLKKYC